MKMTPLCGFANRTERRNEVMPADAGPALQTEDTLQQGASVKRIVLIVADDAALGHMLAKRIPMLGRLEARLVSTQAEAEAFLSTRADDLAAVILSSRLPDGDGVALCDEWRRAHRCFPVIMLAECGERDPIARSLNAGADDCLVRPINADLLFARLLLLLRNFDSGPGATLLLGAYLFQRSERTLIEAATNRRIKLTGKEAALLNLLANDSRLHSRAELLREVWDLKSDTDTNTVGSTVYRLRRKIEVDPQRPTLLISEDGGYRLAASAIGSTLGWGAEIRGTTPEQQLCRTEITAAADRPPLPETCGGDVITGSRSTRSEMNVDDAEKLYAMIGRLVMEMEKLRMESSSSLKTALATTAAFCVTGVI